MFRYILIYSVLFMQKHWYNRKSVDLPAFHLFRICHFFSFASIQYFFPFFRSFGREWVSELVCFCSVFAIFAHQQHHHHHRQQQQQAVAVAAKKDWWRKLILHMNMSERWWQGAVRRNGQRGTKRSNGEKKNCVSDGLLYTYFIFVNDKHEIHF